jgi:tetratricopeptide (TPR) repeat protein
MAQINLRLYNRCIKTLLEQGKASEAADHCRQILMSFPKHIQTYRLFGEASLELDRYQEASEIFKRLLSSVPDDYIAHIGMSVISEEFSKPDTAIWHMSRAYELQPYNLTIQNELRRLYSLRDGIEIRKLSLTRPALARMYARGNLYPQAIAELTSILTDQPERLDLMILLADLRQRTGATQEAVILAHTVLEKLPYCLQAIRLLVEILPGISSPIDLNEIIHKYNDLDPYTRYLDDIYEDVAVVPDGMVILEWLTQYPEPVFIVGVNEGLPVEEKGEGTQNAWIYEEGVEFPARNDTQPNQ